MSDQPWATMREDYSRGGLDESDLTPDPLDLFRRWHADASASGLPEANAMVVSTVSEAGQPSSRMVLLRRLDEWGFAFYTNLMSRKGVELALNPACALLFPWHGLERQVRVEGVASQLLREDVAAYFATRPRGSQLGALASHQSSRVADREELESAYADLESKYAATPALPVPQEWGGYVVRPLVVEFWQGRRGRMHDRLVYRRDSATDEWTTERLAP